MVDLHLIRGEFAFSLDKSMLLKPFSPVAQLRLISLPWDVCTLCASEAALMDTTAGVAGERHAFALSDDEQRWRTYLFKLVSVSLGEKWSEQWKL